MRLVTSAILGIEPSARPLHEQLAQAWAPGEPQARDLLRRTLVLLADHELNASSFTVRCAASTGLNLYDATIAGLAALKGPKHGGAGPLAAQMVAEIAEGNMARKIRDRVALGGPVPGFGHVLYRDGDPRADALLAALARAGADRRLAVEAPAMIAEATGLCPNIDFALAVLMRRLGLPIGHETAIFAVAHTAGWIAHAMEQLSSEALIRPRARYVGPAPMRG
jgi:citrate synthase